MGKLVVAVMVLGGLAACSAPPSYSSRGPANCGPGPVSTNVGGQASLGAGSEGFVGDSTLVFSTRVTPGESGCARTGGTSVGATVVTSR
jgi:hypothetical protein